MARTRARQTDFHASILYDDALPTGSVMETAAETAQQDLNNVRTMLRSITGLLNWYDLPTRSVEQLHTDLAAVEAAVTPALRGFQTATYYPARRNLPLDEGISNRRIATSAAADAAQYIVMAALQVPFPSSVTIHAIYLHARVAAAMTAGTGTIRWAISTAPESVGGAPSGLAIFAVSPITVTPTERDVFIEGLVPDVAVPSGGTFYLVLLGRPDSPGETLSADVYEETTLEITS